MGGVDWLRPARQEVLAKNQLRQRHEQRKTGCHNDEVRFNAIRKGKRLSVHYASVVKEVLT
jgi:hypothetical protein